jgi:hypothetical protein
MHVTRALMRPTKQQEATMAHPKITYYQAVLLVRDWIDVALTNGIHGIQVADYGITQEYRTKGVTQMRSTRSFGNLGDILVQGYDELGNTVVLTSNLKTYNI